MKKYPIYKQDDEYSCGAYCIKMLLKYHHHDILIKEIKDRCRLTTEGISVYGMVRCLQSFNFDAKAYQCDFETLLKEAKLPCIEHVGRYVIKQGEKDYSFKEFLIKHLKSNYRDVIALLIKAIVISVCSIFGSFYFQGLINSIEQMDFYIVVIFSGIFIFVATIRIVIDYQRKNLEVEIQKKLNYEYVNKTIVKMMHLPFRYLSYSRQGAMLTRVQNLFSLSNFFIHFYTVVFMDLVLIIGIIVALFIFSVEIGIVVFIVLLIISLVVIKGMKRINEANKKIITSQEKMNNGYLEYLKNFYNSHQFFLKQFAREKINYLFDKYNYNVFLRGKKFNDLNVVSEFLVQGLAFLVVLIASYYYKKGYISIGDIVLLYN